MPAKNKFTTNKTLSTVRAKTPVSKKRKKSGFADFIREQGVVGLAIGLVLGIQVKALVDQAITSFINPLLGLVLPGEGDLNNKHFALSIGDKQAIFNYGTFIYVFMSFMAVALVIYFTYKFLRLDKLTKKK